MTPKIVVIGSANTDMVVRVEHLPAAGETVLGGEFITAQGGKGANQAVAAARLGAQVTFVARLGGDSFGEASLQAYQREGIHTSYVYRDSGVPSGVAIIMVNQAGENIIAVAPGANAHLSPGDVATAEGIIKDADCVLLQLEIPLETVAFAIELAYAHGVRTILNPAPAAALHPSLLDKVNILTPNQTELALLAGGSAQDDLPELIKSMRARGYRGELVVTLGGEGALVSSAVDVHVPSYPVQVLDTVGAGDAFNGALAVALARHLELADAVRYANAAGALATTRLGAQPALPTSQEVDAFLRQVRI